MTFLASTTVSELRGTPNNCCDYELLDLQYEAHIETMRCRIRSNAPRRFTPALLGEFELFFCEVTTWNRTHPNRPLEFFVLESDITDVFSLGGDLPFFLEAIRSQDEAALSEYTSRCIELIRKISAATYEGKPTSVALVQGTALGGGFEAALSADYIIAEESATFGFPELVFGMFPGMGALQLLMRRIPQIPALRIIESARTYRANELLELGIIDRVVPDGTGNSAVEDFIRAKRRHGSGFRMLHTANALASPMDESLLRQIGQSWIDNALNLSSAHLTMMEKLCMAQDSGTSTLKIPTAA